MPRTALSRITLVCVMLWIAAQVFLILQAAGMQPISDSAYYLRLALTCLNAGGAYPLPVQIEIEPFIVNPGYINVLAGAIGLGGFNAAGLWLNLLFNCALLWILYRLVDRMAGRRTALVFVILFCLLPSNSYIVMGYMSDLPCLAVACGALLLATYPGGRPMALAGLLLVVANYIRPVAMIFALTLAVCMLLSHAKPERWIALILMMVTATAALWLVNGAISGTRFCFANTGGVNALQGANDTADGGYNGLILMEGHEGYISDSTGYNAFQRDSVWKERALDWALANPGKFARLAPRKLYIQLFCDSYHLNLFRETAEIMTGPDGTLSARAKKQIVLESIPYYLLLLLAAVGTAVTLRTRRHRKLALVLLTPIVLNLLLAVATVGGPRYHYPAMPAFIFLASLAIVWICHHAKAYRKYRVRTL